MLQGSNSFYVLENLNIADYVLENLYFFNTLSNISIRDMHVCLREREWEDGEKGRGEDWWGEERILSNWRTNMTSPTWLHKLCGGFSLLLPSIKKTQHLLGWELIHFQGLTVIRLMFHGGKKNLEIIYTIMFTSCLSPLAGTRSQRI